jgi:gluconokinase
MIVLLIGVSGSGKTTIGKALAQAMNARFVDADDYHSIEHIEQMRRGIALGDADRAPWLDRLNVVLRDAQQRGETLVLACSALKAAYRQQLLRDIDDPKQVYLRGSAELIASRLIRRHGHYMNPDLLDSQFEALEEPRDAIVADISGTPQQITEQIMQALR